MKPCIFSECRTWRYTLWREWDDSLWGLADDRPNAKQYLLCIGLNPSTADEENNDPTIRRVIDFAKRWGFGALCMVNAFAYRATDPEDMKRAADPIGPDNDRHLLETAQQAGMILAAWGTHGNFMGRASAVRSLLTGFTLHALGRNKDGSPLHPLYVAKVAMPTVYPRE